MYYIAAAVDTEAAGADIAVVEVGPVDIAAELAAVVRPVAVEPAVAEFAEAESPAAGILL